MFLNLRAFGIVTILLSFYEITIPINTILSVLFIIRVGVRVLWVNISASVRYSIIFLFDGMILTHQHLKSDIVQEIQRICSNSVTRFGCIVLSRFIKS